MNRSSSRLIAFAAVFAAHCAAAGATPTADLPDAFVRIGNEMERVRDGRTGREIVYLTGSPHVDTLYYPTCRSWTADGRFLLLESQRKDDLLYGPLCRCLLAVEM